MKKINPDNEQQTISAIKKMITEGTGSVKFSKSDKPLIHDEYPHYVGYALREHPAPITVYGNKKIVFVNKSEAIDYCIAKGKSLTAISRVGATVNDLRGPFNKVLIIDGVECDVRKDKEIFNYGFSYDDVFEARTFPNKRMLTTAKNGKMSMNFVNMFGNYMKDTK